MAKWYHFPTTSRLSDGEYEANIQGINIVFGAVLGFVLADVSGLPPGDFAVLLFLSASAVVSILYLAHSEYKLAYGALAAFVIFMIPRIMDDPLDLPPIPQLQPTLAVWALMIVLVELIPRGRERPKAPKDKPEPEKDKKERQE